MLGKRWTPQILRGLLSGVTRYTDLKEGVAPISDALLSDRLKELESLGIVRREVTPSTPVRISYGLTTKGEDLAGVIGELAEWAERWGTSRLPGSRVGNRQRLVDDPEAILQL